MGPERMPFAEGLRAFCGAATLCGMVMLLLSLVVALAADSADSGDSGDSAPFQDTDATVELTYTQDPGGCGGESAMLLVMVGGFGLARASRRR